MDANVVRRSLFANVMLSGQNVPGGKLSSTKMFFKSFWSSLAKTEKMAGKTGSAMYKMAIAGETLGLALKSIGKTVLIIGLIEAAMWGLEKLWSLYSNSMKDNSVKLNGIISPTSDASKAFKSLAESLKLVQDRAVKADMSTKEYVDKMDFSSVYSILSNKVVQPLAEGLKKGGKIKTLEDLQIAFQKLGVSVKDTTDAVNKQMIIYHFIASELLKQKNQIVDAWSKISQEVIKKLSKDLGSASLENKDMYIGRVLRANNDIVKKVINEMIGSNVFDYSTSLLDIRKYKYAQTTMSNDVKDFMNDLLNFSPKMKTINANFKKISLGDFISAAFKKGGKIAKKADDIVYGIFIDALNKKKPVKGVLGVNLQKTKGESDQEYISNLLTANARKYINRAATALIMKSSLKPYMTLADIFKKDLPDAINNSAEVLLAYINGLLKAKDRLFGAMNGYFANLQKIDYQKKIFDIIGIKKNVAEENLKAYRKFMEDVINIPINLAKQKREVLNQYEKAFSLIKKDNFLPANIRGRVLKDLKGMTNPEKGLVIIENWLDQLKQNNAKSPLVKTLRGIIQKTGNVLAEMAIANGTVASGLKTMLEMVKKLNQKTNGKFNEKSFKKAESLFQAGNIQGAYKELRSNKKLYQALEKEYIKSILDIDIPKIEAEFNVKKKKIASNFRKLFNFDTVFNFTKQEGLTKIQAVIDKYNELIRQKNDLLIKTANADQAKIKADIAELERKKQRNVEIEKENYLYSLYEIQIKKIKDALDSFRTSTVNFLSDINSFDVTKQSGLNQSIKNYLNDISGTVLNASMSEFWDSIVGKKGGGLAAFLLGENLPASPKEIALDNNTKSIDRLTLAADNLSAVMMGKNIYSNPLGEKIYSNSLPVFQESLFPKAQKGKSINPIEAKAGIPVNNPIPFDMGVKYYHPYVGNNVNTNLKRDKSFYISRALGEMGGMMAGNLIAKGAHRTNEFVGIGTTLMSALAMGNPELAPIFALVGGALGGLFGSKIKDNKTDDKLDKLNDKAKKIIENTEPLKAVDSRIINAPSNFILPPIAQSGGNIQNINITINGASDPHTTAHEIKKIFEDNYNFNNISNNI